MFVNIECPRCMCYVVGVFVCRYMMAKVTYVVYDEIANCLPNKERNVDKRSYGAWELWSLGTMEPGNSNLVVN